MIVIPVAVYLVSAHQPKIYQSSVLIEVQPTTIDTAEGVATGGPSAQFIAIAARLINTTGVAEVASRVLGPPHTPTGALLGSLSESIDPTTGFITITAQASTPERAAAIANAFAAATNRARAKASVKALNQNITALVAQKHALPQRAQSVRNQLTVQLERLRAQRAAQGTNALVIEPATPNPTPISPHPTRDAVLALLFAFLLAIGLVALAEAFDRRIRNPEDLEALAGLPVLASVPRSAFARGVVRPDTLEAFRSLRANLKFFNVDRDISSIVITSAHTGDGKTTVAINLARAYAFSGSDVILIDADLRRPAIAGRLGLESEEGLAGVLIGTNEVNDSLVEIEAPGHESGRIRVLPSGQVPPNPAELLASQRMHRLIEELSTLCDVLIIDTSPLRAVSDALPLLDEASGALVVARLGVVQRDDVKYLRRILAEARCSALGTVATGLANRSNFSYSYSSYRETPEPTASPNGAAAPAAAKKSRALALGRRKR